jgi:hypothetical protein
MHVIRHIAVRNTQKLMLQGGSQNLRSHGLDVLRVIEVFPSIMGAEREEISVFADIGEFLHVWWIGMRHTSTGAARVPADLPPKGGSHENSGNLRPNGGSHGNSANLPSKGGSHSNSGNFRLKAEATEFWEP